MSNAMAKLQANVPGFSNTRNERCSFERVESIFVFQSLRFPIPPYPRCRRELYNRFLPTSFSPMFRAAAASTRPCRIKFSTRYGCKSKRLDSLSPRFAGRISRRNGLYYYRPQQIKLKESDVYWKKSLEDYCAGLLSVHRRASSAR